MNKLEKIIKLGVEGGSVAIYKYYDKKGDDWYFHRVQEMSYVELDLSGVDKKSKHISMSFPEAMINLLNEYSNAMSYFPVFVNLDYKPVIIEFLKAHREEIEMNKNEWFELLGIDDSDLDKDIFNKF